MAAEQQQDDVLQYSLPDLCGVDPSPIVNEEEMVAAAQRNVQMVIKHIFEIPDTTVTDDGVLVTLPKHSIDPSLRMPREKPLPAKKPKTRWQKFAEAKGIKKKKRSRMVWDDNVKDWVPRWGAYSTKHIEDKLTWAIEVGAHDDPYEDPFAKRRAEKKLTVAKQKMREARNKLEAVGKKLPVGVPVGNDIGRGFKRKQTKEQLKEALRRTQIATGSRGEFDKLGKNEQVIKQTKKTKVHPKKVNEEKAEYMKILGRITKGGEVNKTQAAKWARTSEEGARAEANKEKKDKGIDMGSKKGTKKAPTKKKGGKGGGKGGKKGGKKGKR